MAYKIRYNKTYLKELKVIAGWLEKKWSKKTADDFVKEVYNKIHNLSITPFAGTITQKSPDIRKLVITKHNKVYYRVKGNTITVLNLFETKLNPKRNKYE